MKMQRRLVNVYVVIQISLEPPAQAVIDSNLENPAR